MAVILAVNAGSSSVKISVYKVDKTGQDPEQLADAQVSGLTSPPALLSYTRGDDTTKDKDIKDADISDQSAAFAYIVGKLASDESLARNAGSSGSDGSKLSITHVVHRVVHGGDYEGAREINADTLHHLERLTDLAPLHNGPALDIVRAARDADASRGLDLLRNARNIAVFDTSFHATIPSATRAYAIDQNVAQRNDLRRYGFHGISYSFIARAAAEHLGKGKDQKGKAEDESGGGSETEPDVNLIALHLGSGASACAIRAGRSVDTSMGLTPVSGLPGATRSGDVDPALVFHLMHDAGKLSTDAAAAKGGLHITVAEQLLNQKAGWKAMTGTADFGKIVAAAAEAATGGDHDDDDDDDSRRCALAFDLLVDRIVAYVGSYYFKLGGRVDALVFAGGIGEKSDVLRRAVVERCAAAAGLDIDDTKNGGKFGGKVQDVGSDRSRHRILVVQTDEQWEMARMISRDPILL